MNGKDVLHSNSAHDTDNKYNTDSIYYGKDYDGGVFSRSCKTEDVRMPIVSRCDVWSDQLKIIFDTDRQYTQPCGGRGFSVR